MKRQEMIVIGAGPAGLSAAVAAARHGVPVTVYDEQVRPGGQLVKQVHKFFGSKEHHARERGFRIGEELLREAARLGVRVELNSVVLGIYDNKELMVRHEDRVEHIKADAILVAAGASENAVPFDGWTLPGVMGAGAAQTLMNLHGVRPGTKILMLGSGNVGLVIGFQLLQAGCELKALVDAAPRIGGYGVHAAKIARTGVPIYLPYTVVRAVGENHVEGAVIAKVDAHFQPISGTEQLIDCDTILIATGLTPMSQLLKAAGCRMEENAAKGGYVPVLDENGSTSIPGIYAAGDVAGIEEASSAMVTGRRVGAAIAGYLGYLDKAQEETEKDDASRALAALRQGMFAPGRKGTRIDATDEGIPVSETLFTKGYIADEEIHRYPGYVRKLRIHPVMECVQNIPCDPCQTVCPSGCISIGQTMTSLPAVLPDIECIGCGRCVAACPGQAIFLVEEHPEPGCETAELTLPWEFYPYPAAGETGYGLSRSGEALCSATVVKIKTAPDYDRTALLTIRVPIAFVDRVRFYRPAKERR